MLGNLTRLDGGEGSCWAIDIEAESSCSLWDVESRLGNLVKKLARDARILSRSWRLRELSMVVVSGEVSKIEKIIMSVSICGM